MTSADWPAFTSASQTPCSATETASQHRGLDKTKFFRQTVQIDLAAFAEVAEATVDSRVKGDAIARLEVSNINARFHDRPGCLVTHDDWGDTPARCSIEAVHVASADPAGTDRYQNLPGPRLRARC